LFSEVYLSAKSDKFDFHPPMIIDRHQESSPMVGLLSIFKTLETEKVFILSVDAPMVTETVIEKLVETFEAGSADVVVAETSAGIHPLCGLYRTTTYPEIQAHYQKGEHRLKRLLEKVQTVCCFFEDEKLLSNLNHPEEYREALQQTT
ncbi:MAG TPA: molybdenum cofactor guanylyltransferase, partial [Epsilonproteobacteria bacterium]|nr:molybdenum cofactor guanylyltransferase [Campylobacterota bacterium]